MPNYLPFIAKLGGILDYDNKEKNAQEHIFIDIFFIKK